MGTDGKGKGKEGERKEKGKKKGLEKDQTARETALLGSNTPGARGPRNYVYSRNGLV